MENHRQALQYNEQLQYARKLTAAQAEQDNAEQAVTLAEAGCQALPSQEQLHQSLSQLQQLRQDRDTLHTKAQLPPLPQPPVGLEPFRGKDPEQAVSDANADFCKLSDLTGRKKNPFLTVLGIAGILLGAGLLFLHPLAGVPVLLVGAVALISGFVKKKKIQAEISAVCNRYRGIDPHCWVQEAAAYADAQRSYSEAVQTRQQKLSDINRQLEENSAAIAQITGGENISQFEDRCRESLQKHQQLQECIRRYQQARQVLQALSGAGKEIAPPALPDTLTLTPEQTEKQLSDCTLQRQLLHRRLGQLQGQMEALGQPEALQEQADQIQLRIEKLEQYYRALTRAQEALAEATEELQRRFAPRISQQAKELFARMTQGRYDKLILKQDLSVDTGTADETTQWGALWRSDGTVDQLYLSLRLAVARELTPTAPLVLDDALVRFDDTRLAETLNILQEESAEKQVILFTCQSREKQLSGEVTQ